MTQQPTSPERDPHRMPSRPTMAPPPAPIGAKRVNLPEVSSMEHRMREEKKKTSITEVFTLLILVVFLLCFALYICIYFGWIPPSYVRVIEQTLHVSIRN